MNDSIVQYLLVITPSSIALLLIIIMSNFKDRTKSILNKTTKKTYIVTAVNFLLIWLIGRLELLPSTTFLPGMLKE